MSEATEKYTLKSSDGMLFEVDGEVAQQSGTIQQLIEDECADAAIPLPNVSAEILKKVLVYCGKHVHGDVNEDTKQWDDDFLNGIDQATLFDLILAANYLDIKHLLDLTCQTVADMMKGKTVEEIRAKFNIQNDFTPEEEEEIRNANRWAFE